MGCGRVGAGSGGCGSWKLQAGLQLSQRSLLARFQHVPRYRAGANTRVACLHRSRQRRAPDGIGAEHRAQIQRDARGTTCFLWRVEGHRFDGISAALGASRTLADALKCSPKRPGLATGA